MTNVMDSFNRYLKSKTIIISLLFVFVASLNAKDNGNRENYSSTNQKIRFEHLAINVNDPIQVVKWYVMNLGFKVVKQGTAPTFTTFISDSSMNMMLEIFHNADYPVLDFSEFNYMSIHLAFSCDDINAIKQKLTGNGAAVAEDLKKTDSGDQVLVLRDPWGFPIQFVQRVNPMLKYKGIFFEHLAINLEDSRAKAKWYTENLGMKIMKEGKAPNYGMFIADEGENMMLELYQNKVFPVINFSEINHMSVHLAFMADDIEATKESLLKSSAKLVEDINKTAGGDFVLMMRDPWGQPIQFVKRLEPMLK